MAKMFKTLEGHNVLFRSTTISPEQHKLVLEIIDYYKGETKLTRKQLRDAHGVLRGKKAAPYFISKNVSCKTKEHGVYNVAVLKPKAVKETKPKADGDVPAPKKRESKPKKEAKAAKKGKTKKDATVETPAQIEAPAAETAESKTE